MQDERQARLDFLQRQMASAAQAAAPFGATDLVRYLGDVYLIPPSLHLTHAVAAQGVGVGVSAKVIAAAAAPLDGVDQLLRAGDPSRAAVMIAASVLRELGENHPLAQVDDGSLQAVAPAFDVHIHDEGLRLTRGDVAQLAAGSTVLLVDYANASKAWIIASVKREGRASVLLQPLVGKLADGPLLDAEELVDAVRKPSRNGAPNLLSQPPILLPPAVAVVLGTSAETFAAQFLATAKKTNSAKIISRIQSVIAALRA